MDVTRWLRFIIGKENAREFYTAKEIMDPTTFNRVNWHDLRDTLALKPKIFQLWFGKQGLGFYNGGDAQKMGQDSQRTLSKLWGTERKCRTYEQMPQQGLTNDANQMH